MCGILCLVQYGGKSLSPEMAQECLKHLAFRGPDRTNSVTVRVNDNVEVFLGFTRLAIMDTSDAGLQPFHDGQDNYVVCNGEIYNYLESAQQHDIKMKTSCDCEIILPLYKKVGFRKMIQQHLDAEFAMVILDKTRGRIHAARDRFGVRPLYYGYNTETGIYGFASELAALHSVMTFVAQVPPHQQVEMVLSPDSSIPTNISTSAIFIPYYDYKQLVGNPISENVTTVINHHLTMAVKKRLHSDRPIGFLLSGGLDSSLIVAIATKILGPDNIVCFSIGIEGSPDVAAAKKVVEFLGIKNHHIVPFGVEQGMQALPEVIKYISTYDITTIRASVAQYIMAKYIHDNTNIRVLLSGEGSDEITAGYRYFRDAPNAEELHAETIRLLSELYMFDNLRTDRTMAHWGLEVRVPFLDHDYVELIKTVDPKLLMFTAENMEKKVVRDSFTGYLPHEILYRSKEAFSDAVSSKEVNWYRSIAKHAEATISDQELITNKFKINPPETKEALYYRRIFDQYYPGRDNIIAHYWLPRFQKERVVDPSATILKSY